METIKCVETWASTEEGQCDYDSKFISLVYMVINYTLLGRNN
ncbi:MAG: hypothetical protein ACUVRK_08890 [Spirochaetota bacterium]